MAYCNEFTNFLLRIVKLTYLPLNSLNTLPLLFLLLQILRRLGCFLCHIWTFVHTIAISKLTAISLKGFADTWGMKLLCLQTRRSQL